MHGRFPAATHFVPVISCHLQFGGHRHLHLSEREKIVKAGLAGHFLGQKPKHLVATCCLGQPRKERVALAGPGLFEVLEPIDKVVDVAWDVSNQAGDLSPHGLDIFAFGALDPSIVLEVLAPRLGRKARFELPTVVFGKLDLKVFKARSRQFVGVTIHDRSLEAIILILVLWR